MLLPAPQPAAILRAFLVMASSQRLHICRKLCQRQTRCIHPPRVDLHRIHCDNCFIHAVLKEFLRASITLTPTDQIEFATAWECLVAVDEDLMPTSYRSLVIGPDEWDLIPRHNGFW